MIRKLEQAAMCWDATWIGSEHVSMQASELEVFMCPVPIMNLLFFGRNRYA